MQPTRVRSKLLLVGLLLGSLLLVLPAAGIALPVRAQGDPTLTVAPQTIDSAQTATLTAVVTGAGATYTLTWSLGPGTPICPTPPLQSGSSTTFNTPTLTGSTTYCVLLDAGSLGTAVTNVTVTVNPALVAPVVSVSQATIPSGQSANLTTTAPFSGGTSGFVSQWLEEAPGGGWVNLGSPITSTAPSMPSTSTGALATPGTWYFDLTVTDSSQTPEKVTSNIVSVTVSIASTSSSSSTSTSQSSTSASTSQSSASSSSSTSTSQSSTSASTSQSSTSLSIAPTSGFPWESFVIAVVAIVAVLTGLAYGLTRRKGEKSTGSEDLPPDEKQYATVVDPCAELKKSLKDAGDEYLRIYAERTQVLESPPIDENKADQLMQALDALREKKDKIGKELDRCLGVGGHGGVGPGAPGGTPTPPPAPTQPPPSPPASGATPAVVPLRTKDKPPCPDGWVPETEKVCGGEVTLVLVDAPTIEVDGVYQFSKEDVEKAIKGLETYLSVVHAVTVLGGLATNPYETVGGIILPSADDATDGAAEAAAKRLKELNKRFEKIRQAGEWRVVYPREVFDFKCEVTRECKDGDWVVTKKRFTVWDAKRPGAPAVAVYYPQEHRGGDSMQIPSERVLVQARTWAQQQNTAANAEIEKCRKLCE